LRSIIAKAKRDGLKLPKLKIRENITETEAFIIEMAFIKAIGRKNLGTGPLANLTDGGEGEAGRIVSQEQRNQIRTTLTGRKLTEEHKRNISAGVTGIPTSEETKIKLRLINIGKEHNWTPEGRERFVANQRSAPGHHTGHSHSKETKKTISEKISEFHRLNPRPPLTEDTRAKLRAAWMVRKEKKEAMRNTHTYHEEML